MRKITLFTGSVVLAAIGANVAAQGIASFGEIADQGFENAVSTQGIVRFDEIAEDLYRVGNISNRPCTGSENFFSSLPRCSR